jgi:hypothetical protein
VADETERVTMVWPKALKDQVRDKAGQGGMTEWVMEAARIHLGVSGDLDATTVELNQAKHLVQLLADRLVMGGEHDDRLQALMEVELPEWIDVTGWPAPMAALVKPEAPTAPAIGDPVTVTEVVPAKTPPPAVESVPESGEAPSEVPVQTPVDLPHDKQSGDRDDLFAKVMKKTGGKLEGVPGLKVASEVEPPPEPAPVDGPIEPLPEDVEAEKALEVIEEVVEIATSTKCPECGDELIDGECWTCA